MKLAVSGKTTLLESLLFVTGAIHRKGSVKDGNTVGDSAEALRDRHMSVEISAAEHPSSGSQAQPGNQFFEALPRLQRMQRSILKDTIVHIGCCRATNFIF